MSRMTKTKIIVIFMIASMAATWTPATAAFAEETDVAEPAAIVQPVEGSPGSLEDDIDVDVPELPATTLSADEESLPAAVPEQPLSGSVEPLSEPEASPGSTSDLPSDDAASDDVAKTAEEDEGTQATDEAMSETDADAASFRSAAPLASAPMLGAGAPDADSEEEAEVIAPAVDYTRILDHIQINRIFCGPIGDASRVYNKDSKLYHFQYPCAAEFVNIGMDAYVRMKPGAYVENAFEQKTYGTSTARSIGMCDPDGNVVYETTEFHVTSDGTVYFEQIVPKGYSFFVVYDADVDATYYQFFNGKYCAETLAEAIQPRNIPFDFDSDDPWQGIPIELSENPERDPQGILTVTETDDSKKDADITASTTYKGEDGNYYEDDLSRAIQPGDVVRLNVKLVVKGDEGISTKVTYHFRLTSSVDELTEYLNRDLESILTAYISQNTVDLGIAPVQSSGTLGTFKAGDILDLTYVVNVAGMELIDKFQSEDFTIHVDFAFEPVEDVPEEPVEPPVTPPEEPETPETPDEPTPPSEPARVVHTHAVPRTGDSTRTVIPAALLGISLVLIGCGIALRRWQRR